MLDPRLPSLLNYSIFSSNIRSRTTSQYHFLRSASMSGLEIVAVVSCIAAIVSSYRDGNALVQQIKAKRKVRKALGAFQYENDTLLQDAQTVELERSLQRGEGVIQDQYDFQFRRFGPAFEKGDRELSLGPLDTSRNTLILLQRSPRMA